MASSGIAVFAYFTLSMLFLNTWEDYPTPIFVWLIVGAAFASHHESPPAPTLDVSTLSNNSVNSDGSYSTATRPNVEGPKICA